MPLTLPRQPLGTQKQVKSMVFVSKMHGIEVRFQTHHYEATSCLVHTQCATIRMNTVYPGQTWCY